MLKHISIKEFICAFEVESQFVYKFSNCCFWRHPLLPSIWRMAVLSAMRIHSVAKVRVHLYSGRVYSVLSKCGWYRNTPFHEFL